MSTVRDFVRALAYPWVDLRARAERRDTVTLRLLPELLRRRPALLRAVRDLAGPWLDTVENHIQWRF